MKIVHITAGAGGRICGTCLHDNAVVKALRGRGCDARLVCLGGGGLARAAAERGLPVTVLSMSNPWDVRSLAPLRRHLAGDHPDIVHTHGMRANLPVRMVLPAVRPRPLLFTTVHSDLALDYSSTVRSRAYAALDRATRAAVDVFCCVSGDLARRLIASGVRESRVHVVHPGIELEGMDFEAAARSGAASPGGAAAPGAGAAPVAPLTAVSAPGASGPTIGTVARLVPVKDLELLLDAVATVAQTVPDVRLVVVGDGPERAALQRRAAADDLAGRVEFLGKVVPAWPVLARFDVYASSSESEGIPISVLEAMAAGLPVVTTAVGGLPETVQEGVTGYLVKRGPDRAATAAALAGHLTRLLLDPALRARMGDAARSRVRERFSSEAAGNLMGSIYEKALAARPDETEGPETGMLRGRDIICMSSLDWDAHWTSKQQIMHRLAETNRVLYVEEPVTALAPLKVPARWSRWKAVALSLRKAERGLWVLTPPPLSPFGNMYPWINKANQLILAGYVNRAVKKIGMRDPILWTYLPGSIDLIDHIHPGSVLYHCVDEHSAFPGLIRPDVVTAYDHDLTRRADLVLTSAENLRESRKHLNPHIHRIRHAADVGHFASALDPALAVPEDIASLPQPRVGVVGVHDERLDIEAIEALAAADPAWQIVLIGPVRPEDVDEERLRSMPNVHLLGNRPVAELPAYLKGLDVALIPYKLNELTRNIFPLKLYEYLAAGLPVVAAALPELALFSGSIGLAASPAEYPVLVRQALEAGSPEARAARAAAVAGETWESRVQEMSGLIVEMLARVEAQRSGTQTGGGAPDGGGQAPAPERPWPSTQVLGFRLDLAGLEEAAQWVVDVAAAKEAGGAVPARTALAVSFNPELVMRAQEDPAAAEVLRAADLSYADGVGAVWAARRAVTGAGAVAGGVAGSGTSADAGAPIQRVPGIDLAQRVLELAAEAGLSVYLLGARPGVADEAARQQQARITGLRVAGCRDGYFGEADETAVAAAVRASGADILLVAMGAPKQEILLHGHRGEWGARVALGVGGSFDVWAGNVTRAPEWAQRAGVEWLYRLVREPKRLRRQMVLPRFALRVVRAPGGAGPKGASPGGAAPKGAAPKGVAPEEGPGVDSGGAG